MKKTIVVTMLCLMVLFSGISGLACSGRTASSHHESIWGHTNGQHFTQNRYARSSAWASINVTGSGYRRGRAARNGDAVRVSLPGGHGVVHQHGFR